MGRCSLIACVACVLLLGGATLAPAQLRADVVATGLRLPVAVAADPTDRSIFLIAEQGGLVRVVREGTLLERPFLDLRGAISTGGERGLLGLALAPDYGQSRRFFVNFTNVNGDTVVARFLRDESDPLIADSQSRFDLQWPDRRRFVEQPFSNHNGGHLAFGPDDYLYIGLGDGGSGGDPLNNAQDPRTLLGKMLRIDIAVPQDDARGYRVPADNPFVNQDRVRALEEIWAFGLRNPWRYSFDDWTRGGTAALLIADVGQNTREELNFEPRGRGGRNYGWRLREGRQPYDPRTAPAYLPLTEPFHDYGRSIGQSITGGFVYRGDALDPRFNGRYFFADFVTGRVFSVGLHLDPATSEAQAGDEQEHSQALGGQSALGTVSSFGSDRDGELLLLNYTAGRLLRITPNLDLVPSAPIVSGQIENENINLIWSRPIEGVEVLSYAIEVVRSGSVLERIETDRTAWSVTAEAGDCARVRAMGRNGAGPPSESTCRPSPISAQPNK